MTREHARRDLVPSSALPLAWFGLAHAGLAVALLVLLVRPETAGAFFYHPRMVALVHLLTLAWLSGSILGAFYIAGPLALGLPLPVRAADWVAFASFTAGTIGMVAHFWIGEYSGMVWSALLVTGAIGWVGWRTWRVMPRASAPGPVLLHVGLAFINILAAAAMGMLIGLDRLLGLLDWSPLAATLAHAHLAAVGWPLMMVVGLSYRLIPMMLPAAMPSGRGLASSAVLIQAGLVLLVIALLREAWWVSIGALLILGGLASFVVRIRATLRYRLPRPPALPARDWSTWQTHAAMVWLAAATALGVVASLGVSAEWRIAVWWWYGVAGLVGFLAQMVVGVQGRLVPLYAWYRAFAALGGSPPARSAHELPSPVFARAIFLLWSLGVPLLALGLSTQHASLLRLSAALLLAGVLAGAAHIVHMIRRAADGIAAPGLAAHSRVPTDSR